MGDRAREAWPGHTVWGSSDMVAAGHPLVAQAGMQILERGGNAADAAVAAAATATVTMGDMCSLGADAFCLWHRPGQPIQAFIGAGALPQDAPVDMLLAQGQHKLPLYGPQAVAVPGTVRLWYDLHAQRGRLPWHDLFGTAIRLAAEGFPVDARLAASIKENVQVIQLDAEASRLFLPGGQPLEEGQRFIQARLAEALQDLRDRGPEAFYEGAWAAATSRVVTERGGWLSPRDLASHRTELTTPLHLNYRGLDIFQTPPPSQGVIVLEALGILQQVWDGQEDWRSSGSLVHTVIEALKMSYSDRRRWLGDPQFVDFAAAQLLDPEYLRRQASIAPRSTSYPVELHTGDTMSFVIVDRDQQVVSFIQSLALAFGAGVMVPEGGYLLNNRAGRSFDLDPNRPNHARPGKRPMHTLNTWMVTRDGMFWAAGNTPGGDGQVQWSVQVLLDLIDGARPPHQAVSLPRFTLVPGTDAHSITVPYQVSFETRFPPDTVEQVRDLGHPVKYIGPWAGGGSMQVIQRRAEGWAGASDPRGVGLTMGR